MSEPSIHDFVDATDLRAIETVRLSAERVLEPVSAPFDVVPAYEVNTAIRDDGAGFRVILRTAIDVPVGRIQCDISAEYETNEVSAQSVAPEVFDQYVNDVVLMHVLPYTRQAIADITLRVFGNPLVMPIIQRGTLRFDIAEGLREAAGGAADS